MKLILGGVLIVGIGIFAYLLIPTPVVENELTAVAVSPVQNTDSAPLEIAPTEMVKKTEMIKEETIVLPTATPLRDLSKSVISPRPYHEFVNPSAYIHTENQPITVGEHIGKKIIVLSFMTYSCINCKRTFPTLVRLDEEYRDDGLLIIGIHTPEFAFEHDADRVKEELGKYGITFPVVLDNKYETWNAYKNRFWPRRYIIDVTGNIVYDHIGEGDYEGVERVIKALLPTLPTV